MLATAAMATANFNISPGPMLFLTNDHGFLLASVWD
jgi:hypothetical protein